MRALVASASRAASSSTSSLASAGAPSAAATAGAVESAAVPREEPPTSPLEAPSLFASSALPAPFGAPLTHFRPLLLLPQHLEQLPSARLPLASRRQGGPYSTMRRASPRHARGAAPYPDRVRRALARILRVGVFVVVVVGAAAGVGFFFVVSDPGSAAGNASSRH